MSYPIEESAEWIELYSERNAALGPHFWLVKSLSLIWSIHSAVQ